MLKRKVYQELLKWKENTEGKALCIIGARQIGKTTLIREFGKNEYEHFAEINFVTDEKAADIFKDKLTAEAIITNLTAYLQKPLEPGKTLILFDEVQECPAVRSAIKFLVEDGRFDYIESGSLLGVRYKEVRSYPVGFEQIVPMYPLDFEEYLWANGVQDKTLQYLKNCYDRRERVSDSVHETLCKLFYSYLVVGGMPETVQIYIDTHDIAKVVQNQRSILELYRLDIAKYAERLIVVNDGEIAYDDAPKAVFAHYRELEAMGLAAPQITYIMHALKEKGLDVDVTATTVDEAKENILAVLRKCNPGKLSGDKQSVSDSQSKKENAKAETLISEMEADLTEDGTKESHSDAPDEDLSVQKETMDKKSAEQEENEGGQEV